MIGIKVTVFLVTKETLDQIVLLKFLHQCIILYIISPSKIQKKNPFTFTIWSNTMQNKDCLDSFQSYFKD